VGKAGDASILIFRGRVISSQFDVVGRLLRGLAEAEMRTRQWLLGLVVLGLFGISVTLSRNIAEARQNPSDHNQPYMSPWQTLNEQAKLENPTDGNSVRALMDAILDFPSFIGHIPPIIREIVEQRIVQAEINYKLGRNPGIPEKSVVQIVNTLADKFGLSDSARTSLHQLEVLRFGMELSSPAFMTPASSQNGDTGENPSTAELSPAQATHILLVLMGQKVMNPDFQLPLEEWEKTQYQPAMDKMLKYKEQRDSGQLGKPVTHGEVTESVGYPSDHDLRTQIHNAVSKMSLTDGLDLVNQAFGIAGIGK
jgi:hypothetical protein